MGAQKRRFGPSGRSRKRNAKKRDREECRRGETPESGVHQPSLVRRAGMFKHFLRSRGRKSRWMPCATERSTFIENGFEPGPKRGDATWNEFLKRHQDSRGPATFSPRTWWRRAESSHSTCCFSFISVHDGRRHLGDVRNLRGEVSGLSSSMRVDVQRRSASGAPRVPGRGNEARSEVSPEAAAGRVDIMFFN